MSADCERPPATSLCRWKAAAMQARSRRAVASASDSVYVRGGGVVGGGAGSGQIVLGSNAMEAALTGGGGGGVSTA